ncbi:MAG TPA: cytidylate kinase-like family protein [Candidatus Acidoferrum sp.]|nr:cytidylate kinase-like family protein [Candidatus Acidoferrum sp.]
MAVITISREAGSGGDQIAHRVCELLDYRYFEKRLMAEVAREQGISETEAVDFSEDKYRVRGFIDAALGRSAQVALATTVATTTSGAVTRVVHPVDEDMAAAFVSATIRGLWAHGQVVVVGRGAQAILRDVAGVLHVRIIARLEDRVWQVMRAEGLTRDAARSLVDERDRATTQYLRRFHGIDWADPSLYHLTLNASLMSQEAVAEVVAAAARRLEVHPSSPQPPPAG